MPSALALTVDQRWSTSIDIIAEAAAEAGFTSLGIPSAIATEAVPALRANGLGCLELVSFRMSNGDPLEQAKALAAAAADLGAQWVLAGGFRGRPTPDLFDRLRQVTEIIEPSGAGVAIEFSPAGSFRSIDQTLAAIDAIGSERVGVLIDTWHFTNGASTWEQLESVPLEQIAYVQFTDALEPASNDAVDETMNRRAFPGEGIFPLARFADTLRQRGWAGTVCVEVLSRELSELPMDQFCRRAFDTTRSFWT